MDLYDAGPYPPLWGYHWRLPRKALESLGSIAFLFSAGSRFGTRLVQIWYTTALLESSGDFPYRIFFASASISSPYSRVSRL